MGTQMQVVPKAQTINTVRDLLQRSREQIAMALPKFLTPERLIRVAITAIQKTPQLQECEPLSIVGSVMTAAQLGLEPDGILGYAYLVPFYNGKTRRKEAQLQIGYRGFIALAKRSGDVASIYSELVYTKDKFHVTFGTEHKLHHEPALDEDDRGEIRGAYAVVFYKDGTYDFEYMSRAQLDKIRASSKSRDREGNETGPWSTHPEEMYRKTPIRRLAKRLPLSVEDSALVRAAVLDEYAEAGISQNAAAEITDSSIVAQHTQARQEDLKAKYANPTEDDAPRGETAETEMATDSALS